MTEIIRLPSDGRYRGDTQCFKIVDLPTGFDIKVRATTLGPETAPPLIDFGGALDGFCVRAAGGSEEQVTYLLDVFACPIGVSPPD